LQGTTIFAELLGSKVLLEDLLSSRASCITLLVLRVLQLQEEVQGAGGLFTGDIASVAPLNRDGKD
jgi:hypothetical protein